MQTADVDDIKLEDLRAPLTDELIPQDLRSIFNTQLKSYQKETINFLIQRYNEYLHQIDNPDISKAHETCKKLSGFIIGHEMGLGKTVMTLFFLRCIIKHPHAIMRPSRIFIVVNKMLIPQWQEEIGRWCKMVPIFVYHGQVKKRLKLLEAAAKERVSIVLVTYDLITNDADKMVALLRKKNNDHFSLAHSPGSDSDSLSDDDIFYNTISSTKARLGLASKTATAPETTQVRPKTGVETDVAEGNQSNHSDIDSDDFSSTISWLSQSLGQGEMENAATLSGQGDQKTADVNCVEPERKHLGSHLLPHNYLLSMPSVSTLLSRPQSQPTIPQTNKEEHNIMYRPPPSHIPRHCIDVLVIDEATEIKNERTKIYKILKDLDSGFRLALTGTPVLNNLLEFWNILNFLNPEYLGTRASFQRNIERPINEGELQDANAEQRKRAHKARRLWRDMMYPVMIRRTVGSLSIFSIHKVTLTFWTPLKDVQFALYKAVFCAKEFQRALERAVRSSNTTSALKIMHFLRQICEHPCQLSNDEAGFLGEDMKNCILQFKQKAAQSNTTDNDYLQLISSFSKGQPSASILQDQYTPLSENMPLSPSLATDDLNDGEPSNSDGISYFESYNTNVRQRQSIESTHRSPDHCDITIGSILKLSSKFTIFLEIMRHIYANGHRVLIFCEYLIIFDIIERLLSHNNINYLRIDGNVTDSAERKRRCVEFNNNRKYVAFLISIRLGAMGLNLTGANRVIIFSPNWNFKIEEQAMARAYRMGQKRNVVIYKIVCTNTIEEKIVVRQLQKAGIANTTVDDQKHQSVVNSSDLKSLFLFNERNRMESSLPDNIQRHATPQHVKKTIQHALGATLKDDDSEASTELRFIKRMIQQGLCKDVSVLDYLYSEENLDESILGDSEMTQHCNTSQFGAVQKDKDLQLKMLVQIYLLSHHTDLFVTLFESIAHAARKPQEYLTRMLNKYHKTADNANSLHLSDQQAYGEWALLVAKTALLATVKTCNQEDLPEEILNYRITYVFSIRSAAEAEAIGTLSSQLCNILLHFVSEVDSVPVPKIADVHRLLGMSTCEQYDLYIRCLAEYRYTMFCTNRQAFELPVAVPCVLDSVLVLAEQLGVSLRQLEVEYDDESNWQELQDTWSFTPRHLQKKVPVLWGPIASEIADIQKIVITNALSKQYRALDSVLLDRCLSARELLQTETAGNTMVDKLSLVRSLFNSGIETYKSINKLTRVDCQWNTLPAQVQESILADTYHKINHYHLSASEQSQSPSTFTLKLSKSKGYRSDTSTLAPRTPTQFQHSRSPSPAHTRDDSIDILS